MKERIVAGMNDIIIGTVKSGSFHFPIEFELMGMEQSIDYAVYDTGCSHSLISVDSLNLGETNINEFKEQLLYSVNTYICTGSGVESSTEAKKKELANLGQALRKLNALKKKLIGNNNAEAILHEKVGERLKRIILESPNIRFGNKISGLKIDGVSIGDFDIRLAFGLGNVNLIGMHIIRELHTKIFSENGTVYLLAKKKSPLADIELDIAVDELKEHLEMLDKTVLEANYINTYSEHE